MLGNLLMKTKAKEELLKLGSPEPVGFSDLSYTVLTMRAILLVA